MSGLVHLYCGDGKGKTTAAVGLSVRAAGSGLRVLFVQFLKSRPSGEIAVLSALANVRVLRGKEGTAFSFQMTDEQKRATREMHDRNLAEDGIIVVTVAVDGRTGQVVSGPELVSRGFVYVRESEELLEGARTQVEMALDRSMAENLHDWASVKARVREALSNYIYRRTKRSPMILPILLEV